MQQRALEGLWEVALHTFPSNLIARMFGFQPETFYETDAASREEVKVSFA